MSEIETRIKPRIANLPGPGPGRPKGLPNKSTVAVKQALQMAFEGVGGVPALTEWARENQGEFYKLYAKLLPTEVKADVNVSITLEALISQSYREDIRISSDISTDKG
jgi:hypothetical protein